MLISAYTRLFQVLVHLPLLHGSRIIWLNVIVNGKWPVWIRNLLAADLKVVGRNLCVAMGVVISHGASTNILFNKTLLLLHVDKRSTMFSLPLHLTGFRPWLANHLIGCFCVATTPHVCMRIHSPSLPMASPTKSLAYPRQNAPSTLMLLQSSGV